MGLAYEALLEGELLVVRSENIVLREIIKKERKEREDFFNLIKPRIDRLERDLINIELTRDFMEKHGKPMWHSFKEKPKNDGTYIVVTKINPTPGYVSSESMYMDYKNGRWLDGGRNDLHAWTYMPNTVFEDEYD